MESVCSKRVNQDEPLTVLPANLSDSTQLNVQSSESSTVEIGSLLSENISENCSSKSDKDSSEDEYDFTCDDAKSILREWIADQPAEVSHIQGILLVEVLMRECGMSKTQASQVATSYTSSSERSLRRWHTDFYTSSGDIIPEEWGALGHTTS